MKNYALITAGTIFGLMALGHLLRVLMKFQITINGMLIPWEWSVPLFAVALILAVWMFVAARSRQ